MNDRFQLPSDPALVDLARAGSAAAWTELRSRHVDVVEALARSRARPSKRSVDAVFHQLRDETAENGSRTDDGCDAPIRPRLIGLLTGGTYGPVWSAPAVEPDPVAEPSSRDVRTDRTGWKERTDRNELVDLAVAFGGIPSLWQAVLWHRWVERAPAAELTAIFGRSPSDVVALEQTAQRGLVDGYAEVALAGTPSDADCVPVIPRLGALRRGTLPDAQRGVADAHVASCSACRRLIDLLDRLADAVPVAIVPDLTGLDVDRYRGRIGAGTAAMDTAALSRRRSAQGRLLAQLGAGGAVVLALLSAAFFV